MANQEHLDILKQGVVVWKLWRQQHPEVQPDLREADLSGANLSRAYLDYTFLNGANLSKANLREVSLFRARLGYASLSGSDLSAANLRWAGLSGANLSGANLSRASLSGADMNGADLSGANLDGTDLNQANLVRTNLAEANLTNCLVYGISAWDVQLEGAKQYNLVITHPDQSTITVDNLKVAQFIYLLLNNREIGAVIDTISKKVVLILGRFSPERKVVLDALRAELRKQNYTPVLFDFDKPSSKDLTETVSTLAHLARFIIVDLTDPSSAIHEVASIIPLCIVPIQPLLLHDNANPRYEYAMFQDLRTRYHWVLPTYQYQDISSLLTSLQEHIIEPAEQKAKELSQH